MSPLSVDETASTYFESVTLNLPTSSYANQRETDFGFGVRICCMFVIYIHVVDCYMEV